MKANSFTATIGTTIEMLQRGELHHQCGMQRRRYHHQHHLTQPLKLILVFVIIICLQGRWNINVPLCFSIPFLFYDAHFRFCLFVVSNFFSCFWHTCNKLPRAHVHTCTIIIHLSLPHATFCQERVVRLLLLLAPLAGTRKTNRHILSLLTRWQAIYLLVLLCMVCVCLLLQ